MGLGAKILCERMKAQVDPLGPENMIGFLAGVLVGTGTPMATKYTVVANLRSTNMRATQFRTFRHGAQNAGYDGVFITGAASKPVCLLISNGLPLKSKMRAAYR
jgi:aldehyde:ferredoxin oxidoreductase